MSFMDRVRAWFTGESKGQQRAPSKSTEKASRASTKELDGFVGSRVGVEGYLEPHTTIYPTTLLLVAADGEYLRRPIRDRAQAEEFCTKHGLPLYDAARVGYPKRMRDYDRGIKRDTISLEEMPPWPGEDGTGGEDGPPTAAGA